MGMENFVKKVFEGEKEVHPSVECLSIFNNSFPKAAGMEWFDRKDFLEVIFYEEGMEHIARLKKEGSLIDYRKFLPEGYLPESIKNSFSPAREIMNVVLINRGNTIEYEVISRDEHLVRYLTILTDLGRTVRESTL